MKKTIDYEGASPLGKYCMSSKSTLTFYFEYTNNNTLPIIDIFANLAGYLDSKSDDNRQMTKETILDFWDRMAEAKNYSQVDRTDFKKRTHRLLSKKNPKNQKHQLMNAPSFLPTRLAKSPRQRHLRHDLCYFLLPFVFHMSADPGDVSVLILPQVSVIW